MTNNPTLSEFAAQFDYELYPHQKKVLELLKQTGTAAVFIPIFGAASPPGRCGVLHAEDCNPPSPHGPH